MVDDVDSNSHRNPVNTVTDPVCANAIHALQQTAESLTQRYVTQFSSCTYSFTEQCSDEKGTASHAPPADTL